MSTITLYIDYYYFLLNVYVIVYYKYMNLTTEPQKHNKKYKILLKHEVGVSFRNVELLHRFLFKLFFLMSFCRNVNYEFPKHT